ncbi:TPA: hypothetical protein RPV97_001351 [Campylobacter fetus subsp. venerealis]|nr:hypothetical protein [Campylobacter fetus subsp. venerealis]
MQYAVALVLASIVFFAKKIVVYTSFIAFLAGGFFYLESVPFALKYFFLFVLIFSLVFDLHRRVFVLQRDNSTLAHIILLEQDNE